MNVNKEFDENGGGAGAAHFIWIGKKGTDSKAQALWLMDALKNKNK